MSLADVFSLNEISYTWNKFRFVKLLYNELINISLYRN